MPKYHGQSRTRCIGGLGVATPSRSLGCAASLRLDRTPPRPLWCLANFSNRTLAVPVRDIVLLGEEVLRTPGNQVTEFDDDLRALVGDMWETMYHAEGIGLAAPQIGLSLRLCVLDVRDEDDAESGCVALVNPVVAESSKKTVKAPEGCLSIPGLEEVVTRPAKVTVKGFDLHGQPVEVEAEGLLGRVLQHETDHLDGILFIDRVSPLKRRMLLKKWKKLQEEE